MGGRFNHTKARATLARYGIDADADIGTLEAAIVARGWHVELERVDSGYGAQRPRFRALAWRLGPPAPSRSGLITLSVAGPIAHRVVWHVLAKVLDWEERGGSSESGTAVTTRRGDAPP